MDNKKQYFFSVKRYVQAYGDGFNAFSNGVIGTGPYPSRSMTQKEWLRGWNDAYYDNLDKISNG